MDIVKVLAWVYIALNAWSILYAPFKVGKVDKPYTPGMVVMQLVIGSTAIYLYWHLVK
jgi:hypothetical protein